MKLFEMNTSIYNWEDEDWTKASEQDVLTAVKGEDGQSLSMFAAFANWADRADLQQLLDKLATDAGYEAPKDTRQVVDISPTTIFYRGTRGDHGTGKREGYATFVSTNPYQAATYAGPEGIILSVTLHPDKAFLFDSGRHHSFLQYDEQARKLGKGQALVVTDLVDRGGFQDGIDVKKSTTPATNVSFTDSSIAQVTGKESASKYFQ